MGRRFTYTATIGKMVLGCRRIIGALLTHDAAGQDAGLDVSCHARTSVKNLAGVGEVISWNAQ